MIAERVTLVKAVHRQLKLVVTFLKTDACHGASDQDLLAGWVLMVFMSAGISPYSATPTGRFQDATLHHKLELQMLFNFETESAYKQSLW